PAERDPCHRISRFLQEVEVPEGVPGLRLSGVPEETSDIRVTLDVGYPREVEVTTIRLGLAGERLSEIVVTLGALERLGHRCRPPCGWATPGGRVVRAAEHRGPDRPRSQHRGRRTRSGGARSGSRSGPPPDCRAGSPSAR